MTDKAPSQAPNTGEPIDIKIGRLMIPSIANEAMASVENAAAKPIEEAPKHDPPMKNMQPDAFNQIKMEELKEVETPILMDANAVMPAGAANAGNDNLADKSGNDCGEPAPVEPMQGMQILRRENALSSTIPPPGIGPKRCEQELKEFEEKGLKISEPAEEAIVDAAKDIGELPKMIEVDGTVAPPSLQADQQQLHNGAQEPQADSTKQMLAAPFKMVVTNGNPFKRDFHAAGHFGMPNAFHSELPSRVANRHPDYFYTADGSIHFYQPQYFEYIPEADENRTIIMSKTPESSATDKPKDFN